MTDTPPCCPRDYNRDGDCDKHRPLPTWAETTVQLQREYDRAYENMPTDREVTDGATVALDPQLTGTAQPSPTPPHRSA